jgi:hypothetical protein
MTFLNFALVGGVAALSIPIIIHLFHKSRFQVVKWGAMHLLESVIRTNQRRIRIEQIILLMVRAAIPLILALLMARPVWKGAQALLGDSKTSTVVLLDNSYSMEASRAGQTNFAVAREEAARIVNNFRRGSDVQVILMGEGGSTLLDAPTYDIPRAAKELGQLDAGFGAATVPAALGFAASTFEQMTEPSRNVVVITDFQRVSFQANEDALLGESIGRLKSLALAPTITFFDVGQEIRDNVAVESLDFSKLMIGVGQRVRIRANLRNYGEANYPDLRVYLKVDGTEKAASQLSLGANETGQVLFTHAFDTPGSHVVEITADADTLKADNTYLASIPVRDKLPVLLVNGDPNPEALKGETDFAEIALQPYSAARVESADLIATKVIRPEEMKGDILTQSAVVILANVRRLDDGQLKALEEFVKTGGGLLVFPGDRVDAKWWTESMWKKGEGLLPAMLGPLQGELRGGAPTVSVLSQRYDNPALELFNDPRNGTIGDSAIRLWFQLQQGAASAAAQPATELAKLENGDAFLLERPFGEGRVILCSTALDADWSNLPLKPSYLPLLQRLTVYLASTIFPPRNLEVGRQLVAFLPPSDSGKKAILTLPDGSNVDIVVAKKGERGVVEYGRTQRPGLYTLTPPGGQPLHFVVNASRRESDLQKLTAKEVADLASTHGVNVVRSGAEYENIDNTRRYGWELWKPMLWVLLGFCFIELFLQQKFARARGTV